MKDDGVELTSVTWMQVTKRFRTELARITSRLAEEHKKHEEAGVHLSVLASCLGEFSDWWECRLEDCAEGLVAPELVWFDGPNRLFDLSMEEQRNVAESQTLDVLNELADPPELRPILLRDLTEREVAIAVEPHGRLRSLEEQLVARDQLDEGTLEE